MKVKLLGKEVLKGIYNEEDLSELSVMESIYAIRSLKAVIDTDGAFIEVQEAENGAVYSEKYQIGFQKNEYELFETEEEKLANATIKSVENFIYGLALMEIKEKGSGYKELEKFHYELNEAIYLAAKDFLDNPDKELKFSYTIHDK